MSNQVTLTFAGKTQELETSLDRAGQATEVMAVRMSDATNASAERFDHLSAQSSLLSGGIGDIGGALTTAFGDDTAIGQFGAKMEEASAIVTGFTGIMDLGVFATNNFRLGTLASTVQTKAAAVGTKAYAAAQWLMNTALFASPITWIVIGIVALIAVIVLIARKTDWFSQAWRASWKWIKSAASNTWDFIKKIPGWTGQAFSKIASFITAPYKAAFNGISRAWNRTVGGLSFTVPSWVPFIGGNGFSVPHLPTFHAGGVVPGVAGTPTMALLQAGERVTNVAGAGGGGAVTIGSDGSKLGDALVDLIAAAVRKRGGRPADLGLKAA